MQNSYVVQMKSCVPVAELLSTFALVVELLVRHLRVACFLDETNNSNFETTIDFVKMALLHVEVTARIGRGSSRIHIELSANCAI